MARRAPFRLVGFRDCVAKTSAVTLSDIFRRPLGRGAEFFRLPVTITGPHPYVHAEVNFSFSVCLRNGLAADGGMRVVEKFCRKVVAELTPIFQTRRASRVEALAPIGRFGALPAPATTVATGVQEPTHDR